MTTDEPFLVEPGWVHSDVIGSIHLRPFRLLTYADGTVGFEHRCDRGERGVIICAPALSPEHRTAVLDGKITVAPSILCSDCGTHGFIRGGRWADA